MLLFDLIFHQCLKFSALRQVGAQDSSMSHERLKKKYQAVFYVYQSERSGTEEMSA